MSPETLAYGKDKLQTVDVYDRKEKSDSIIIYVHGGAWRTGDKTDHSSTLLEGWSQSNQLRAPIVSINYHLSTLDDNKEPVVSHPAHLDDVLAAIHFTLSRYSETAKLILAGHSCGAFLLLLALQSDESLSKRTSALICIEGIYDLSLLVEEYPSYLGFVEQAHSSDRVKWPAVDFNKLSKHSPSILILHSKGDELLTLRQPQWFIQKAAYAPMQNTTSDYESLSGEHDALLDDRNTVDTLNKWLPKLIRH